MKDSIETIWKQGFMKDDALIAPKINDLYHQKSKDVLEKLHKAFKWNLIGLLVGVVVIIAFSAFSGTLYLGVFISLLLLSLVVLGKKQLKELDKIDKNVSSYAYLKSFDSWFKSLIAEYTTLYRYFYPLLFLGIMLQWRLSGSATSFIQGLLLDYPNSYVLFDTPAIILVVVFTIAALLAYFAAALYRCDMDLVYGRLIKRLDEIIADMEELRR